VEKAVNVPGAQEGHKETDLRGCNATGGEDIRGKPDKMKLCEEECKNELECILLVF
jgi:hypothetical protein